MAEAYAVLTRQPYGHPAANVLLYLQQFTDRRSPAGLSPSHYPIAMQKLADADITGAAIYDGLIAAAVLESELKLMSFDRRAARVYELFDIDYEILT
jgi:predicted nucleic acid-binding protein